MLVSRWLSGHRGGHVFAQSCAEVAVDQLLMVAFEQAPDGLRIVDGATGVGRWI